jgi:hypothetical protein
MNIMTDPGFFADRFKGLLRNWIFNSEMIISVLGKSGRTLR